jgi:HEXXH motif-containing protein
MPSTVMDLRGFSCPSEPLDESLFDLIITEHANQAGRLFLSQHASLLRQQGSGVVELLERTLAEGVGSALAWELCWGEALRAVRDPAATDPRYAAASLALWLGASGLSSTWALDFPGPVRMRWGRLLLPPATRLALESDGRSGRIVASVDGGEPRTVELSRTAVSWRTTDEAQELPSFGTDDGAILLLPRDALTPATAELLELHGAPTCSGISPQMLGSFQQTIEFLQTYAPAYVPWVLRVLRLAIPLQQQPESSTSGSSADAPGLMHLSFTSNPRHLGESLIHEATHQYLHILRWTGAIDDGSDQRLHYSPLKRCGRPLEFIVVAFHAVINILLYYRECLRNGAPDDGYFARNQPIVLDQARQLAEALRGNSALTPNGVAICDPLLERISE